MKIDEVRRCAFAMPLTSPAFPPGPYRFIDREYLIIIYRTDPATLEAVVPEPLTFDEPLVKLPSAVGLCRAKHITCVGAFATPSVEAFATPSFARQTTSATAPPARPRIAKSFATQS
jgi:acetoacetate decarboxylase